MSSTPETEVVETFYYEMVEMIVNAANTFVDMHPTNNTEQVKKMVHLFTSVTAAFIDLMPGLDEEAAINLTKTAYLHAKSLANKLQKESLN